MNDYERIMEQDLQDEGYFKTILPEWFGREEESVVVEEEPLPEPPESLLALDAHLNGHVTDEYVRERTVCPCEEHCGFAGACVSADEYDDFSPEDYFPEPEEPEDDEDEDHQRDWEFIREILSRESDILDDAYDWARSNEDGWYYRD